MIREYHPVGGVKRQDPDQRDHEDEERVLGVDGESGLFRFGVHGGCLSEDDDEFSEK